MDKINADLAYWQNQLGLQAWQIRVDICRSWQMPGVNGSCERWPALLKAKIQLIDELDYGENTFPVDIEVVLVHELLHVYHATFEKDTAKQLLEEQGVELTARALVRLRRAATADPAK